VRRRVALLATTSLAASSLLAGCDSGGGSGGGPSGVDADAAWRTSTAPVETSGLAWAVDTTVHLPDGSTIDTGEPIREFVVAGDGVFFVPAGDGEDDTLFEEPLWFVAPGGEPEDTGLQVTRDHFATSPDGRFLTVLDADTDEGSAVMRIFDLSTGELHDSEDGMDTSGIDDPVDHLLEMEVDLLGIDDEQLTARVIEGDFVYDLATGEGTETSDAEPADPLVSPDGAWRIDESTPLREVLVSETGEELVPDTGTRRWGLSSWLDDTTVVGFSIDGPGTGDQVGPDNSLAMMTCTVPDGECISVEGTDGQRVLLPYGIEGSSGFDLTTREE
jgi:hypothetical protein